MPPDLVTRYGAWGRATLAGWRWQPCATAEAADGAMFALADGRTLRVIAAPGHTPGNLAAYVAAEGAETGELCSGDTLLATTHPNPGLHFPLTADGTPGVRAPSLPAFLASVAALRAMGVRTVWPGHGAEPITGVEAVAHLIERFEHHHARRLARVQRIFATRVAALEAAGPPGASAYDVVRAQFPHLPAERLGQAMTEAVGHLDVLHARGVLIAAGATADGVERYVLRAADAAR
jgi:glyoxylase-like metal-dependent hydrolase (beta-lactamase superfamily II)